MCHPERSVTNFTMLDQGPRSREDLAATAVTLLRARVHSCLLPCTASRRRARRPAQRLQPSPRSSRSSRHNHAPVHERRSGSRLRRCSHRRRLTGYEPAPPDPRTRLRRRRTRRDLKAIVAEVSAQNKIDADFIASVIAAESANNPHAVSPKGAQGLMQLMPGTASKLGVKDSFDPAANVDGGVRYLRAVAGAISLRRRQSAGRLQRRSRRACSSTTAFRPIARRTPTSRASSRTTTARSWRSRRHWQQPGRAIRPLRQKSPLCRKLRQPPVTSKDSLQLR